ncbi:hypothetical protein [Paenibacillus luteus]|uniref:hypothetical protein n=1 Tax=Paenibacillus luteus TaxID=2545753 RepID=UPI0011419FFC|nr:hypothetical protein [Paenibacillus luteus]
MKLKVIIVFCLALVIFSTSGADRPLVQKAEVYEPMKIRSAAYHSLSEAEQSTIVGDWKQTEVKMFKWVEIPFKRQKEVSEDVKQVVFKTKYDALLGPIGIYVDPSTQLIIGYDLRD